MPDIVYSGPLSLRRAPKAYLTTKLSEGHVCYGNGWASTEDRKKEGGYFRGGEDLVPATSITLQGLTAGLIDRNQT